MILPLLALLLLSAAPQAGKEAEARFRARLRTLLQRALFDASAERREGAVGELCELRGDAASLLVRVLDEDLRAGQAAGRRERVARLVEDLDADDITQRDAATIQLIQLGAAARPALEKALRSSSAEVRERAREILGLSEGRGLSEAELRRRELSMLQLVSTVANNSHLKYVVRHFEHPDPELRVGALKAWEALALPRDVDTMEKLLEDPEPGVRRQAVESLRAVLRADGVPRFLDLARKGGSPEVREAAAGALIAEARLWKPGVADRVLELAREGDAQVRKILYPGLLRQSGAEGEFGERLLKALDSAPREAKLEVLILLHDARKPGAVRLLLQLLRDGDGEVAKAARLRLTALARPQGDLHLRVRHDFYRSACRALAAGENAGIRRDVLGALYSRRMEFSTGEIAAGLASSDAEIVSAAATAMESTPRALRATADGVLIDAVAGETPFADLIPLLRTLLAGAPGEPLRTQHALSLASLGDGAGRHLLPAALESPDPALRLRAIRGAGRIRATEASAKLQALAKDPDALTRAAALQALSDLGDPAAPSAAVAALGDASEAVRILALVQLGRRGDATHLPAIAARLDASTPLERRQILETVELLPLTAAPDLLKRLAESGDKAAQEAAARIDRRREIPQHLEKALAKGRRDLMRALGQLGELSYDRLRYRIEPGAPDLSENPFAEDGSIRVGSRVLSALSASSDGLIQRPGDRILAAAAKELPGELMEMARGPVNDRVGALEAMRRLRFRDAVPLLRKLIDDESDPDRLRYYAKILRDIDPAEGARIAATKPSLFDPAEHLRSLGLATPEETAAVLAELLGDSRESVRGWAQRRLLELPEAAAIDAVGLAWAQGKPMDRRPLAALFKGVKTLRDPGFSILREILKDGDRSTRIAAAEALVHHQRGAALEALMPFLKEEKPWWPVIEKLGTDLAPRHAEMLEAALEDASVADKAPFLFLRARMGRVEDARKLADLLPAASWEAARAFRAFEGCRDPEAVAAAAKNLLGRARDNWFGDMVGVLATTGLRESHPAVLAYLEPRTKAGAWDDTCESCLDALLLAPDESQLGVLRALGAARKLGRRRQVVEILRRLGTPPAVDALMDLMQGGGDRELARAVASCTKTPAQVDRILAMLKAPIAKAQDTLKAKDLLLAAAGLGDERMTEPLARWVTSSSFDAGKDGNRHELRMPEELRLLAAEALAETAAGRRTLASAAGELRSRPDPRERGVALYADWVLGRPIDYYVLREVHPSFGFLALEARFPQAAESRVVEYARAAPGPDRAPALKAIASTVQLFMCRELSPPERPRDPSFEGERAAWLAEAMEWVKVHRGRPFEEVLIEGMKAAGYDLGPSLGPSSIPALLKALRDRRWFVGHNASWALSRITGDRFEARRAARMRRLLSGPDWSSGNPYDSAPLTEAEVSWWEARAGSKK